MSRGDRAVITGLGVVAPNGIGIEPFWRSLIAGRSGIGPITLFSTDDFIMQVAGEVKGFDLAAFINGRFNPKRMGRHTQLALAATRLAIKDAGVSQAMLKKAAPVPVVVGVSNGGVDVIERNTLILNRKGPERVSPYCVSACSPHAIASEVADMLEVETQTLTIASACAAALDAVAAAADLIRMSKADLAITGGADAPINPITVAALASSGLLPHNFSLAPEKISRPFDRDRVGGIISEAAGVLVIENLQHALARDARIYAEIVGYGSNTDTFGTEAASGLEDAMEMALANACCRPDKVQYVCAHGPSDLTLDRVETNAIKSVMKSRAYAVPVSSIKGVTGNPLCAAGALECATSAMAIHTQCVPPTANYENPDPDCDLDYVPEGPRRLSLQTVLLNAHGLGGGNASLILEQISLP